MVGVTVLLQQQAEAAAYPFFYASYQRFEGTLLPSLVVDKNRKQKKTETTNQPLSLIFLAS
jgi:hypothetical protein